MNVVSAPVRSSPSEPIAISGAASKPCPQNATERPIRRRNRKKRCWTRLLASEGGAGCIVPLCAPLGENAHNREIFGSTHEPSSEPCGDEISLAELAFWLGNPASGQVECSCGACLRQQEEECEALMAELTALGQEAMEQECGCGDCLAIPQSFYTNLEPMNAGFLMRHGESINNEWDAMGLEER